MTICVVWCQCIFDVFFHFFLFFLHFCVNWTICRSSTLEKKFSKIFGGSCSRNSLILNPVTLSHMFLKAPWESSGVFREMIKDNFPLFDLFHPRIRGQINLKCCDYFFKQNKILTLISLQNLILIISPFSSPHRSLCCIQVRQLVAPKAEKGDFDLSVSVSRLTMSVGGDDDNDDDDDGDENDLFSNLSSPTKQQCSAQRPRFWLGLVCSAILHHISISKFW